jgi:hypothetical protein
MTKARLILIKRKLQTDGLFVLTFSASLIGSCYAFAWVIVRAGFLIEIL